MLSCEGLNMSVQTTNTCVLCLSTYYLVAVVEHWQKNVQEAFMNI